MPIFNNILAGSSGQSTGYDIDQSLRFDDGDAGFLDRTPVSNGDRRQYTMSFWFKRGKLDASSSDDFFMFEAGADRDNWFYLEIYQYKLYLRETSGGLGNTAMALQTSQVFRDHSAWYHIVIAVDTDQSTAADRC